MHIIADLHVHSKHSRAVSRDMDLAHMDRWAAIKGIGLMGTGDCTHPAWFRSLTEELTEDGSGLLTRKADDAKTKFLLSVELSCIYKQGDRTRRIHLLVLFPTLEAVRRFNDRLGALGNIRSDGRPILGLKAPEIVTLALEAHPNAIVIPAHIWTPWFSLFGSESGFDTIEECFGDTLPHIPAVETGLSSDPSMNWRLSQLDPYSIVSFSDAHSPKPNKMGREVTEFEVSEPTYDAVAVALRSQRTIMAGQKPTDRIFRTIEFFPEEGKYHWDGHRAHDLRMSPAETKRVKGICPKCGTRLTIGVLHRVEMLADRAEGFRPNNRPPFVKLIPLEEIIAEAFDVGTGTKRVTAEYLRMTKSVNELRLLLETPLDELQRDTDPLVFEGIRRVRDGHVDVAPGYDGVFGTVHIFTEADRKRAAQGRLFP